MGFFFFLSVITLVLIGIYVAAVKAVQVVQKELGIEFFETDEEGNIPL